MLPYRWTTTVQPAACADIAAAPAWWWLSVIKTARSRTANRSPAAGPQLIGLGVHSPATCQPSHHAQLRRLSLRGIRSVPISEDVGADNHRGVAIARM
jgi:hypothetical protein